MLVDTYIEDNPTDTFISIANCCQGMNSKQLYAFIKKIELEYECIGDTELGDFLNEFVNILIDHDCDDTVHQEIQDLVDCCELSEEMLETVGKDIEQIGLWIKTLQ